MRRTLGLAAAVMAGIVIMLGMIYAPVTAMSGEEAAERKVTIDQVPAKVKAAILDAVGDGELVDIGEITEGGKKYYEIEMVIDGKEYDVLFDSDGKVLKKTFEGYKSKEEGKEEEGKEDEGEEEGEEEGKSVKELVLMGPEKKVTIGQVPEEVKAAILKAVGDGELVDIGVFTQKGGKNLYEIEMVVDGKEFDVLFDSGGNVLRKTFEGFKAKKGQEGKTAGEARAFQSDFDLENREFSTTGRNKYFILEPGYQLVLEGKEGEKTVRLIITVLDETKTIGGIETRVVEERETEDGELIEISRNFFAICNRTKSAFYFGEEVDIYADGKMVGHEGAWLHGEKDAHAGMMMAGEILLGARYYQEVAPGVAMDRAEIVDTNVTLVTPAGKFTGCVKCQEENPLDKEKECKIHAPGIGLVQDEDLLLIKYGFAKEDKK